MKRLRKISSNGNEICCIVNHNPNRYCISQLAFCVCVVFPLFPLQKVRLTLIQETHLSQIKLHSNREKRLSESGKLFDEPCRGPMRLFIQQMNTRERKKKSKQTILWRKSHDMEVNSLPEIHGL